MAVAQYDKDGNVTENTDSTGRRTSYRYNAVGNCLTQTEHIQTETGTEGRMATYVYNLDSRKRDDEILVTRSLNALNY